MKHIILAIALAFTVPTVATAQDKVADACSTAIQIAEVIMLNRQAGTPISKMMEIADGDQVISNLILLAYNTPRFSTREYQENAVVNFTNEVGLACYKGLT